MFECMNGGHLTRISADLGMGGAETACYPKTKIVAPPTKLAG
jgi:hypothetical protein